MPTTKPIHTKVAQGSMGMSYPRTAMLYTPSSKGYRSNHSRARGVQSCTSPAKMRRGPVVSTSSAGLVDVLRDAACRADGYGSS